MELIFIIRKEFNLHTISIGSTNTYERDMFVIFEMNGANISIDYKYYDSKLFLDVICNDDRDLIVETIKKRVKEIIK